MTLQVGVRSGDSRAQVTAGRGWGILARLLQLLLGFVWALTLMVGALWIWDHALGLADATKPLLALPLRERMGVARVAAVGLGALATLIFLVLVADDLCPRVPAWFRRGLWGCTAGAAVLCMLRVGWTIWVYRT